MLLHAKLFTFLLTLRSESQNNDWLSKNKCKLIANDKSKYEKTFTHGLYGPFDNVC